MFSELGCDVFVVVVVSVELVGQLLLNVVKVVYMLAGDLSVVFQGWLTSAIAT
jgi:hypothetical protein